MQRVIGIESPAQARHGQINARGDQEQRQHRQGPQVAIDEPERGQVVIALAVTGLTLFTATLTKLREYGILKALGAGTTRLALTVAAQAAWSVTLALAVAVVVSMLLGAAIGAATPNVEVAIQTASIVRTGITALAVGALASLIPLRRVLRVDPATAFRRP